MLTLSRRHVGHHRPADWLPTGYFYLGYPVFCNSRDGDLAYEADYERLVQLPAAAAEVLMDRIEFDHANISTRDS